MLIIIEGCDGTGKTTLANQLANSLNATILHFGVELSQNPHIRGLFLSLVERSRTENIIIDRFIHGQFIYQKPEERVLSLHDLLEMEKYLIAEKALLFLVEIEPEEILRRMQLRGEETKGFSPKTIMTKYRRLFKKVSLMTPIIVRGETL